MDSVSPLEQAVLEPPSKRIEADLFGLIWRRKWIILGVLLAALPLGYLLYLRLTPVYQSRAQVLLIKQQSKHLPLAGVEGQNTYDDALSTHMLLLRSPLIVNRALEKHRLAGLATLREQQDPAETIIEGLEATRAGGRESPDPNVMNLTYKGGSPEDCATVLGAVIQTYQDFLGETYQNFSDETVRLISQAKDVLQEQLAEKEAAYRKFRQESPLLMRGKERDNTNLHATRMSEIEATRSEILVANAQTRAKADALESALQSGINPDALVFLADTTKHPGMSAAMEGFGRSPLDEQMLTALVEEQNLSQSFGPDHPQLKAVRRRIALLRDHKLPRDLHGNVRDGDFLKNYLESLREDLRVGEQRIDQLDALFESEREAAKELMSYQLADETHQSELARTQLLFDSVIKRLDEISLVKDYGGVKTQLLSAPTLGLKVEPKLFKVLAIFGFFGTLLGFGLSYVVELVDTSFRSPDEIRRRLGLPIVGQIPRISKDGGKTSRIGADVAAARLDRVLCAFYQPKGRLAEAYRAVRTALYFYDRGAGHKAIQVTSPNPGDGKTTSAANLALTIADSGKSVVLIDADFRRPRVHQLFGLKDGQGLSSVVAGEADLADVTHSTPLPHLSVIPCGPRPHNPSELLTSPEFREVVERLKDQYDFVIIDTPPLLAVTDSSIVVSRVDAVLLVVSLRKNTRDAALRAAEILNSLDANTLGVIVNRVDLAAGYGSEYGYGYGSSDGGYYEEDNDDTGALVRPSKNGTAG